MKKNLLMVMSILLTSLILISCGKKETYTDVKSFINDMISNQETYIESVKKAANTDEFIMTVNTFVEKHTQLAARTQELKKKYPDIDKWDENPPVELKDDFKRLDAAGEKMEKVMADPTVQKFLSNAKVRKSLITLAEQMEKAKFF